MRKAIIPAIIIFCCFFTHCTLLRKPTEVVYNETASGLKYNILKQGDEITPEKGDLLTIHYIAKLEDGEVIDDTYKRNEPLSFRLGRGHVIEGWEEGLPLMTKGAKAEFVIPSHLAYGGKGVDKIPPNSSVKFIIELIDIEKPKKAVVADPRIFEKTVEEVKYTVTQQGHGKKVEPGSIVSVHYKGYFEDGILFDNSFERGEPIEFLLGEGMVLKGWDIVFENFRQGDKATIWIPYHLAYGKTGRGPVPPETNIMFDIEVLDVFKPELPEPFEIEGLDTLETLTGIQYFIVEEGSVIKPEVDDIVVIHYTGYLPDGEVFDSSIMRGQPFRFVVGGWQVIHGWDEVVRLLGKGSKARIIIPPNLAYGDRKVGEIPPNSTLIFDVELIDIIK